jgi:hypothetical protein
MHGLLLFYVNQAFTYVFVCLLYIYIYIYVSARALCVYILFACSSKNLCGKAQLDARYVTVCSAERAVRVLWCCVDRHGWSRMLQIGIRGLVFNTEPG